MINDDITDAEARAMAAQFKGQEVRLTYDSDTHDVVVAQRPGDDDILASMLATALSELLVEGMGFQKAAFLNFMGDMYDETSKSARNG